MPRIFLSYRRADTQALAGRIADSLRAKLGKNSVYLDIDTAPAGSDFRDHISKAIVDCDVLLILIGEHWLSSGPEGANRLLDPKDTVRIEIEAALAANTPIIPLLGGQARFPTAADVPESVAPLLYRTALRVDDGADYHTHIDRLVQQIRQNFKRLTASDESDAAPNGEAKSAPKPPAEAQTERPQPAPAAAMQGNGRIPVTVQQGLAIVGFLVALNSILAALGSMLWGAINYWPAFMVSALACAYFGYWGVLVAILSPIVSSLLMIGGAPAYLYIPSNALQALLVILAFRLTKLDPGLPSLRDKVKYLVFGAIAPSAAGGALAWWLRQRTGMSGESLPISIFYWTLENTTPVLFPGFWLHGVVATVRRPFEWSKVSYLSGWVGRTFEYTAPWVLTLFIALSISLFLVASRLGQLNPSADAWSQIRVLAGASWVFRLLVLGGCLSILVAVGFSIRHGRQTWHLEQAVRRSLANTEDAERILAGRRSPNSRKLATVLVLRLGNFAEASRSQRPARAVDWFNACYDCLAESATRYSGKIDNFAANGSVVIFDAQSEELHASLALRCAAYCAKQIALLNQSFVEKGCPECVLGIGIHTGPVITGEIGSGDRRRYTIIGDTVDIAAQMAREAAAAATAPRPIITLSAATMREAGINPEMADRAGLGEAGSLILDGVDPIQMYTIDESPLLERRLHSD